MYNVLARWKPRATQATAAHVVFVNIRNGSRIAVHSTEHRSNGRRAVRRHRCFSFFQTTSKLLKASSIVTPVYDNVNYPVVFFFRRGRNSIFYSISPLETGNNQSPGCREVAIVYFTPPCLCTGNAVALRAVPRDPVPCRSAAITGRLISISARC